MARLSNKTAIISGAAQGMGAVTAHLFIEHGAKVILGDILVEQGESIANKLGKNAMFVKLDVTKEKDWEEAIKKSKSMGTINVLINNAGILQFKSIAEQTTEEFINVLNVNLVGSYNGIRSVINSMKKYGSGSIINISSLDGLQSKKKKKKKKKK